MLAILLMSSVALTALARPACAQIVPDNTLGTESSRLAPQGDRDFIEGGAIRESTLFHSFTEFNVSEAQQVYFANPAGIEHILTRVTGNNISNILGTLGVDGAANLFFINPNGIIFGPEARLDISGSFVASTADSIQWGEDGRFSATNPQESTLLTIQPGVLFVNVLGQPQGEIRNQGNLAVGTGQTLTLEANTVTSRGALTASGGTVQVFGEQVNLFENASIDVSSPTAGGRVVIGNRESGIGNGGGVRIGAGVGIRADALGNGDGGTVIVNSGEMRFEGAISARGGETSGNGGFVEVSGSDLEFAGSVDTSAPNGTVGTLLLDPKDILIQAGSPISGLAISQALFLNDVILQADNDITVDDNITGIGANNLTLLGGRSLFIAPNRRIILNGGDFTAKFNDENALVPAERDPGIAQFSMSPGSQILTNGGNVTIASGTFGQTSQINTANAGIITSNTAGNSGNITLFSLGDVTTGLLDTRSGTGNGGNISVTSAGGAIATTNKIVSDSLFQAGNISIQAAGNLTIKGGDVTAFGATPGAITIATGDILSAQGVAITSATLGTGIPNDVTITAQSINLENSSVGVLAFGAGQGGNVLIQADDDVVVRNSQIGSIALNSGNAGDLTLNARRLIVIKEPGATIPFIVPFLGIGTIGVPESTGNGGDLTINASESIEVIGNKPGAFTPDPFQLTSALLRSDTGIASSAFGSGNSGNLTINTGRLVVRDGAGITTFPAVGIGGDLTVNAREIFLQGEAGMATSTLGFGDAGDMIVNANNVTLTDGAAIGTTTFGSGNASRFELTVGSLSVRNGSFLGSATLAPGNGGSITIKASDFVEVVGTSADGRLASFITANALTSLTPQAGNAGTIDIETDRLIVRQGGEISTATFGAGQGGDIQIQTRTLQLDDGRINASTFGAGDGGDIAVRASESVDITGTGFNALQQQIIMPALEGNLTPDRFNRGIVTITGGDGDAGNVSIVTPNFVTRDGGLVATTTLAGGEGGNIAIDTRDTLVLDDSLIGSGTFTGADSGDVTLSARRLIARGGAQVLTTTFSAGQAGDLTANVSDSIELINLTNSGALLATGLFASSAQTASGDGGDININIPEGDLSLRDGATVSVSAEGEGNAGDINIDARSIFLDRASISATSTSGEGGNINLRVGEALILRNNSQISTRAGTDAGGGGNGGNMNIEAEFIVGVPQENSDITANAFAGNGGNIEISTQSIFGLQVREELTPLSDITASSQLGIDGTIQIDRLSVDPSRGLAELPTAFSDPSDQIVASCPADEGNRFVVTGRGGIPTLPSQYRRGRAVWRDTRDLSASTPQPQALATEPSSSPLVEAQGWIVADNGTVVLTAEPHQGAGEQGSRGARGQRCRGNGESEDNSQ